MLFQKKINQIDFNDCSSCQNQSVCWTFANRDGFGTELPDLQNDPN